MPETIDNETLEAPSLIGVYRSPNWVADRLDVHPTTVLGWIRTGELVVTALGRNSSKPYRIAETDLHAFLMSRRTPRLAAVSSAEKDPEMSPEAAPVRSQSREKRRRKPGQLVAA